MQTGLLTPGTLYYRVFHDSPVGMIITTVTEGRYVEVNAAYARLLNTTPEGLRGQSLSLIGLENEDERNMVLDVLRRVGKLGNIPLLLRRSRTEPLTCIASVQVETFGGQDYLIIIVQDITEQEHAQSALRSSEQRFRLFFQCVPMPLLVVDDATGRILDVNTTACRVYGYSRDQFTALQLADLSADSSVAVRAPADSNDHQPSLPFPACHRLQDGGVIDVDLQTYSFMLDDRPVTLYIVEDVTEQRANQAALSNSEERLRIIAEVATDAIWDRNMATDEVIWSSGLGSLFGYIDEADRPHDWWISHIHPHDRPAVKASLDDAFASNTDFWKGEYRFLRADGQYANVLDRGHILRDASGRPVRFIGAMVDRTEQFQLAEAAARAALEERQRLARDLHDSVTQSLYSISLMAEAARRRAKAGDQDMILEFINRLGELSQQALRQLRLLVYELRPGVLAQEGLAGALRHRLEAVERRAGIKARLIDETTMHIPLPLKGHVFRIAQEALNHSLKFAAARSITVKLGTSAAAVTLQIGDDGLSLDQRLEQGRHEIDEIRRHVAQLGGQFSLSTVPGSVIMHVRVPLNQEGELSAP